MKYYGKIKNLRKLVISDPMYENDVWCRYEQEFKSSENWYVSMQINHRLSKLSYPYIELIIAMQKNSNEDEIKIYEEIPKIEIINNYVAKEYTIGMDSACVSLGINEKADMITQNDAWQPSFAIRTGTDGTFGYVKEYKKSYYDLEPEIILIKGYIDSDFITEEELLKYIKEQLEFKVDFEKNKEMSETELEIAK